MYIASFFIELFLFDSGPRILDKPAKVLLLIPLIFLLNAVKINHKLIISSFIISSFALFCVAIYEKYTLGAARVGNSINAIQFGAISIAIAAAALALTASVPHQSLKQKLLLITLTLLSCGGLVAGIFTQSRGSIIAIPIIFILLSVLYLKRENSHKIKAALIFLLLIAVTGISMNNSSTMARFEHSYKNAISFYEGRKTDTSSGIRLGLWQASIEAGLQSPITGVGYEGYVRYKNEQVKSGRFGKELLRFDDAHNTYVYSFARRGLIGLVTAITFLGFPIYLGLQAWRKEDHSIAPYAAALTAFGSVFVIANLSQEVILLNTGIIMYTGLLVILTSLLHERMSAIKSPPD
ncbi:O-antigen ligase [uncultured Neptuniibacter sp.]|uniref:O-antigen ligase family protein n=1 Tax=uncultured Neptuniibacter sp. TaxID=502143 RepID=UPI00263629C6|nr:O-antigen ligase family protein [uncultured Neptuniibacter sp.]